jgi:hypothetical protein
MTKNDDIFDLTLAQSSTKWLARPNVYTAETENLPITLAEKRSAVEARKQLQVIDQERRIGIAGHNAVGAIYESQFTTMATLIDRTWEVCKQPRDPVPQTITMKCWQRTMARAEVHLELVTEGAVDAIAGTVDHGTYVNRVPSSQGVIATVTGKDNGL